MHCKKRMTFHSVDYIVVPVELWDEVKNFLEYTPMTNNADMNYANEIRANMLAYEGSDEPEELK